MDQVIALSVGNPLAIRELIADPGALTASPADFPRPLSVSLSQVYARRATELDPEALTAARCAAVAGHELAVVSPGLRRPRGRRLGPRTGGGDGVAHRRRG